MCKANSYVTQINEIFDNIKADRDFYRSELQKLDLEEQDLLHFIEKENFNAARGYCLAKQIKEVREKRRKVKLELATISSLYAKFVNGNDKKIINLQAKIQNNENTLNRLSDNKIYNPRVLKEVK